jgi:nitrogen regulatory protein P-II 1
MKEIKAILRPNAVTRVVSALHALPHFPGFTLTDALGQGRGRGQSGAFVVTEETLFFQPRKVLTVFASDDIADAVVETIRHHARTGHAGDGLIVVTEISQTVRIRSGEAQDRAL